MQSEKSKLTAYLLWLAIGAFGAHRFYLGRVKSGIALAVLLIGCIVVASAGGYILVQAIENEGGVGDMVRPFSPYMILSFTSGVLFLVWAVWYLLDLIFINVMINKDRKNENAISTKQAEKVFE